MNLLKRTAGLVGGTVRSIGTTLNVLTGGVSVNTEDIPISPTVVDTFSLKDVELWMKRHLTTPDEPVKIAVVRQRHGHLWKVSLVVLNQRNKRCTDSDGRLRAQSQLVRGVCLDLDEFLGSNNSVLMTP